MAKKKLSPRTERRSFDRAAKKLGEGRERLARLEPGGDPTRPVPLESASQVEPHALALPCLRCGSAYRLDEHAAVPVPRAPRASGDHGGSREAGAPEILRVAKLRCSQCGARREVWFRLAPALPN
jgi:ribosomal protein L44E